MADNSIYKDIARRTGGDIYVGVVGPARTGKSTFIHRFIESVVLPNIEDEYDRQRTLDQMPQSASGRTIMTTEPKFVPDESVRISLGEGTELNVKLVDCVGYMTSGALGTEEGGEARMVMTPWSKEAMPFAEAAELGTGKVIGEHSTIGMLVTTDGTICDIPRAGYVEAEERVAAELRALGKPFAIILNSAEPDSEEAHALASSLEEKYGAPVALVSCLALSADDVREILALVLGEFPIKMLEFTPPAWVSALPEEHRLRREAMDKVLTVSDKVRKLGDLLPVCAQCEGVSVSVIDAGEGTATIEFPHSVEEYYATLSELSGIEVSGEGDLISVMCELAEIKKKYERVEAALTDVEEKGYGIVMPSLEELSLEEPEVVKQPGGWGVKVTAHASSIHMIKTGIKADLCPVVGSEEQSEEIIRSLTEEYEENPSRVWEFNMFGKSLYELVADGMAAKLGHMPDESRERLSQTLGKIIDEGANGLICILL